MRPRKLGAPRAVSPVSLVVALAAEARPLTEHFRLKATKGCDSFRVYGDEDICLIVSGPGKISAASATSFLYVVSGGMRNRLWLNIGIAGQRNLPIGTGILAHKITGSASGRSWYPPIVFHPPCETKTVLTIDQPIVYEARPFGDSPQGDCPQRDGPGWDRDPVYEMEAAGFYDTATRFSTAELVQCFKVISDDCSSASKISAGFVEQLIADHLGTIDLILDGMRPLAAEVVFPQFSNLKFEPFLKRWHFTVTERHQLRRLLERLRTLDSGGLILNRILQSRDGIAPPLRNAAEVLRSLERQIHSIPVRL